MKKEYIKPAVQVVKLQQQHIICTSPGDYNDRTLGMPGGQVDNEEEVF